MSPLTIPLRMDESVELRSIVHADKDNTTALYRGESYFMTMDL